LIDCWTGLTGLLIALLHCNKLIDLTNTTRGRDLDVMTI